MSQNNGEDTSRPCGSIMSNTCGWLEESPYSGHQYTLNSPKSSIPSPVDNKKNSVEKHEKDLEEELPEEKFDAIPQEKVHSVMADVDMAMAFSLMPSLVQQLGKALIELKSHKDSAADAVSFTEISEHFCELETKLIKKYTELEDKEKAVKTEESDARVLIALKEAAVAAKEQDMFDRIQILKDAAVAFIVEKRANHLQPSVYTDNNVIDGLDHKVSCSLDEQPNACLDGESSENVTFRQELTQFCEQMDTHGLLTFVMKNRKNITVLREELSDALKSSTEPCHLILNLIKGFYPSDDNNKKDSAMRQSCIDIMESMNAMLAKADLGGDRLLNYEVKQQAKAIAEEWRPKLGHDGIIDAANGKSLEVEAFLLLLVTFRIASEFDQDELCKLVFAVCEQRQAPELCRSLGLEHKMPGVIKELISKGKQISAVHFVHAFELVDKFPTVPLLKTYLKDLRRNSQGKRGIWSHSETQNERNMKELVALKAIIHCVQKYHLEADYPLDPLHKRVGQLIKAKADKKRVRESSTERSHNKIPRPNGVGVYGHHSPAPAANYLAVNGRQAPASYAALSSERYPHVNPHPHPHPYPYPYQAAPPPPTSQTTYSQRVYEQSAYYYPTDDRAAVPPPPAPQLSGYGGYPGNSMMSSYQPYM